MSVMLVAVGAAVAHESPAHNRDVVPIRQVTAQYHDLAAAEADGYVLGSPCVPGMGYHYVNFGLVDDTVDATQPETLVYAPSGNGLKLVAVEYMATESFDMLGHSSDPPGAVPFYTLHAWVWLHNNDGTFHETNPKVTCPAPEVSSVE